MFCAISGEPPTTPVISTKSGLVYEARLIRKYVQENGKDPISGEELLEDDLLEIRSNPKIAIPRPPTLSSVPSLLTSLQNEYDSVMLEMFSLRKSYDNVRQELSHALYANDSANRVVARLMWERDEARSALASIKDSLGQGGLTAEAGPEQDSEMAEAAGGLPSAVLAKIEETSKALSSTRKSKLKRKPTGYPQAGDIGKFGQSKLIPSMHSTKQPGVTCLDVSVDGSLILTGGNDKQVQMYDNPNDKILATLKGHTKGITQVSFVTATIGHEFGTSSTAAPVATFAVSASLDSSVRVWKADETGRLYSLAHTINEFKSPVAGICVHPSAEFFAAACKNGSWALYDLSTGSRLLQGSSGHELTSLDIHPDGILMSLGTSGGVIQIIDIRTGQESATFEAENKLPVNSQHFSENGYYLASATSNLVEVWDLRKLVKAGSIAIEGDEKTKLAVRFDHSAQFLAVVGTDVRIYANKTWQLLWSDDASNTAEVSDVKWDWSTGNLITASLDRTVRTFAPSVAE
ncbi:hypothetical protein CBS101457_004554 [Exobasidium rhododendri]|nr:hypothetical protein CBS101457_004554 [Exobasidium rhododendri]